MEVSELCAILERLDVSSSIANDLQNELNGEPVLHAAITLPDENKHQIVKALIRAGADCDRRNESGLTACECALTVLGSRELAAEMIATELENLSDDRAFYVMIRRGSLAVFTLFLELRKFEEGELFQLVANAMVELNTKRVKIDCQLETFLQYHLADYAFRNLCGDTKSCKDVNEWRMHFKVIADNWSALREQYNDREYANIDNEFVHRIQTIHNHLYFVKDKRFLKHLPMMETVFCLAIFVATFKWRDNFQLLKWIINKLNIMQFLDVICRQLDQVELHLNVFEKQLMKMLNCYTKREGAPSKEHFISCWTNMNTSKKLGENILNKIINGLKKHLDHHAIISEIISNESFELSVKINRRDRSTLSRLGRCYFRTKQLYSIQKCVYHIQSLSSDIIDARADLSSGPAVKRVIQVIGEAIKSTKNSPNVPKKVVAALGQMLTDGFPITNKYFREFFSHKYSLAKCFLFGLSDANYFAVIAEWFDQVEMIFLIIFLCSVVEAVRALLGSMRRCQSLNQLKSLLEYVGDIQLAEVIQTQQFKKLEDIFKKMSESISSMQCPMKEKKSKLEQLKHGLKLKGLIFSRLRRCLISEWIISFKDIKVACLGKADLATIHKMVDWNLTFCDQSEIYDGINRYWITNHVTFGVLEVVNTDLLTHNPSVMTGLLRKIEYKLRSIEDEEYVDNTRQILKDLGQTVPPQELVDTLYKQLLRYYENIFFLDNKYRAIKQLFKSQKLHFDEECFKRMRTQDEESLQKVFDDRVNDLRQILQVHGISSVQSWVAKSDRISDRVILALEYCQLELCEMLISVGYFGDNFNLLKHRIPMIQGRNYRNYLAHDPLSYNVLTESARSKVIANALVMVNNTVSLFGKYVTHIAKNFSFSESKQTLKWAKIQSDLAKSILQMDPCKIQRYIDAGADLLGEFCGYGIFIQFNIGITSLELIDPNCPDDMMDKVKQIFESKFPKSITDIASPKYRSWHAFQSGKFDSSFSIFAGNHPVESSSLPQHFYYWENLIYHLPKESLDCSEKDHLETTILHRFVKAGNYRGVEEILKLNPNVDINAMNADGFTAFDLAIRYGFLQIAKLLSLKNPTISEDTRQLAMVNHLNDLLSRLFIDYDEALLLNQTYIMVAIRANNFAALEFIVDHLYSGYHGNLKNQHLSCGTALAAYFDHYRLVQFLLSLPNMDYFTDESISSGNPALQHAIHKRNWLAVKLLLQHGASPNWVNPDLYLPNRTAFQMAVEASSCKVLRMMTGIDRELYRSLEHPLSIAIRNDSPKMIRYLQSMEFTLLDSNSILLSAVKCGSMNFVEQIFHALASSVDGWKRYGDLRGKVGQLLRRWSAIGYLEDREFNYLPAIMQAIEVDDWECVSILLDKSRLLRKVDEQFISGMEVYTKSGLRHVYGNVDSTQNSEMLEYCRALLKRLEDCVKSTQARTKAITSLTSKEIHVECYRSTLNDRNLSDFSLTSNPTNFQSDDIFNCQKIIASAMQLVESTQDLIFGIIHEKNSEAFDYFVACSDVSCLVQLCATEPHQPLKSLVNSADDFGETPLHMVGIHKGNLDQMKLLLANGANPIATNEVGQTPLHISLVDVDCSKSTLLLNYCIEHGLMSSDSTSALELPNGQGCRPIHYAAMFFKLSAVQLLLERGVDVRVQDQVGFYPVFYAVGSGNPKILRHFLDHDPELVNIVNDRGQTLLHKSAKWEEEESILMLLEYNSDITAKDHEGIPAVQLAIGHANSPWVKIVLFYARVNGIRGLLDHLGMPVLHYSTFSNKAELVRAIVEYEIDQELSSDLSDTSLRKLRDVITSSMSEVGFTALHIAVRYVLMKSVEMILYCQARHNQYSEEKIYLAHNAVDLKGKTPLDYALEAQDEQLINMLLNGQ